MRERFEMDCWTLNESGNAWDHGTAEGATGWIFSSHLRNDGSQKRC
jgi:hypothetical protein